MRILLVLLSTIIAGCATAPRPMPAPVMIPPPEKCINIPGEGCKKFTAGNVGGTTLGHSNDEDISAKAAAIPKP